jgi:hypothetical protein
VSTPEAVVAATLAEHDRSPYDRELCGCGEFLPGSEQWAEQAYAIAGRMKDWDSYTHVPCGTCGAEVKAHCTFTVNTRTFVRHAPCLDRLKAAEEQAS